MWKPTPAQFSNSMKGLVRKTLAPVGDFTRRQKRELIVAFVLAVAFALIVDRGFKYWERLTETRTLRHIWDAVATIVAYGKDDQPTNLGCGIFVQPNGVLVIGYQVVRTPRVEAKLASGAYYRLKDVIREDAGSGITVLQFEGRDIPFVDLGDSSKTADGERVLALMAQAALDCSISPGVISRSKTKLGSSPLDFIQFATAAPGTGSGGLFNTRGEVIGIISSAVLPADWQKGGSALFAVPINRIKAAIQGQGAGLPEGSPEYFYSLGVLAEHKRQYDNAVEYLRKAISLNERYADAYLELGNVYYAQGAYDKELQAYQKAFMYAPTNVDISYALATAYEDMKMYDQAIAQHLKTLDIRPDYKDSLFESCILYIARGETANAGELAARLEAVDPGLAREIKLILSRTR